MAKDKVINNSFLTEEEKQTTNDIVLLHETTQTSVQPVTRGYNYWITKDGWNPNERITRQLDIDSDTKSVKLVGEENAQGDTGEYVLKLDLQ